MTSNSFLSWSGCAVSHYLNKVSHGWQMFHFIIVATGVYMGWLTCWTPVQYPVVNTLQVYRIDQILSVFVHPAENGLSWAVNPIDIDSETLTIIDTSLQTAGLSTDPCHYAAIRGT